MTEILSRVPALRVSGAAYHEPFIGGGALFFEMSCQGLLSGTAYLSDANPNLIEAYVAVRDSVDDVIALLRKHAESHSEDYFYEVRTEVPPTIEERAARLIYLNRTCFNGLYRENSKYSSTCRLAGTSILPSATRRTSERHRAPYAALLSRFGASRQRLTASGPGTLCTLTRPMSPCPPRRDSPPTPRMALAMRTRCALPVSSHV